MSKFRFKAVANNGQLTHGMIEASDRRSAIEQLQQAGHLPISADEIRAKPGFAISTLTQAWQRDKVGKQEIAILTGELAILLQAGLPLDSALKTLSGLNSSAALKGLIGAIHERVRAGATLSDALAAHTHRFDRVYLSMIRAGEASGSLELTISRLADYLERSAELRASVLTALIYPAILLVVLILSLVILMTFVVPQFAPLFEDTGQVLPLMTRIVFGVAGFFNQFWWLFVGATLGMLWFANHQLAKPDQRQDFDAWCLKLPYLGELIKTIEMARFSRTLGTALENGVPLLTGVRLVKGVVTNRMIGKVTDGIIASLEQGQGMARPMKESGVCPVLAVQLIEVGEETGQLESMLNKIADIYERQVKISIRRTLLLLEPVLIIGMGGLIAFIIAAILVAILGLNDLVV